MKKLVTILGLVLTASTVFAGECTALNARDAANAFFNKRYKGHRVFVTSAQAQEKILIGNKELEKNLKIQFTILSAGAGVMADIGEIELHPGTCEVVKLNSNSALLTTFEY